MPPYATVSGLARNSWNADRGNMSSEVGMMKEAPVLGYD
jgi:hypothetical protein